MYFYGCFQIDVLINPLRWAEVKIWKFYLENFVVQKKQYKRGIPPCRDETFHM